MKVTSEVNLPNPITLEHKMSRDPTKWIMGPLKGSREIITGITDLRS